jgi:hypothetical protein
VSDERHYTISGSVTPRVVHELIAPGNLRELDDFLQTAMEFIIISISAGRILVICKQSTVAACRIPSFSSARLPSVSLRIDFHIAMHEVQFVPNR